MPIERWWLTGLIGVIGLLTALQWTVGQGVPLYAVLAGYTVFFVALRTIAAKDHQRTLCGIGADNFPKISVIVPAHNEEAVIAGLVENLSQIDYPNFDVLVVDDRSSDRTGQILTELRKSAKYRFAFYSRDGSEGRPGKAAVLNEAIGKVDGDLIAVFDADARVAPNCFTEMVTLLHDPKVAAVQARKVASNASYNLLTLCQQYEFALDGYLQSKRDTIYGAVELRGNGMLIRRAALVDVDGFSENNLTEDLELSTRLQIAGWDLRYADDVEVREEAMPELQPLIKQRLRWTEGSLIRYLEHGWSMVCDKRLSFRTKLDMMQFVFECILPVWMLFEALGFIVKTVVGGVIAWPSLYAIPATIVLSVYFLSIATRGVLRFETKNAWEAFRGGVLVFWLLTSLWGPVVFRVLLGIITRKERNLVWVKTEHFGTE